MIPNYKWTFWVRIMWQIQLGEHCRVTPRYQVYLYILHILNLLQICCIHGISAAISNKVICAKYIRRLSAKTRRTMRCSRKWEFNVQRAFLQSLTQAYDHSKFRQHLRPLAISDDNSNSLLKRLGTVIRFTILPGAS